MAKVLTGNTISKTVIKGVNDISMSLQMLAHKGVTEKDVDKILKTVAAPLIDQMKFLAPVDQGGLQNSITVWSGKKRPYRVYVGPSYKWKGSYKLKNGNRLSAGGSIAHMIEYGTVSRVMKKGLRAGGITQGTMEKFKGPPQFVPYKGKKTGVVMARPFIRPAVESTRKDIEYNLKTKVVENIITAATKLKLSII